MLALDRAVSWGSSGSGPSTGSSPAWYRSLHTWITAQPTAVIGTARMAPKIPPTMVPTVRASSTTIACRLRVRPITTGWRRSPSIWLTTTTTPATIRAVHGPLVTSATRSARIPAAVAPTIGTNPPMNTMTASGSAKGTPSRARGTPMNTASTAETTAVPRT